ncbi:hypothetical protein LOM8899_00206 [Flavimaricola marinus]|uniref:Uncharacterized protein n=1 Tax=Flavimaricola marinus TaxID=1819565 RepID=A0A238L9K0_9RHOB|nr:hypothetical protein LOM8899_00206 [Flavimaricola marinus]
MAYLDPTTLTCPSCGLSGEVVIVVGVGPGSRKGDIPYKKAQKAGPFDKSADGTLGCPTDGTEVWRNRPAQKAEQTT